MNRYLIASDFDGTLCIGGRVSDRDKAAIRRFREAGNLFGIVTGRITDMALDAASKIEHDFVLACTGGVILDQNHNILHSTPVPPSASLPLLFRLAKEHGSINFLVRTENATYSFPIGSSDPERIVLPENEAIHQVCFFIPDEQKTKQFIHVATPLVCQAFTIHQNGGSIDMPAVGVSKQTGIEKYAQIIGIDRDRIFTVGDQRNDIPMLRAFRGFAVSNALDEVKEAAPYACDRVEDMIDAILTSNF